MWIVRIHFVEEGIGLGMGCFWERYTAEREQYQIACFPVFRGLILHYLYGGMLENGLLVVGG